MKKIKIFEYDCMLFFLTQGFSLISLNIYTKNVKTDAYLIPIIGTIIGIIPLLLFTKIKEKNSKLNINSLNIKIFGKIFGNIINTIFIILAFIIGAYIFFILTNFISVEYLYKTPLNFISFAFALPTIYILTKNISIISRSIVILIFIEIILFITSSLGLFGQINTHELFPIFQNNISEFFKTVFLHVSFILTPLFFLNIFSKNEIQNSKNLKKHTIITYLIGNIVFFLTIFFNISILGIELIKVYQYPEYEVLKFANIAGFINNLEPALAIYWMINLFSFIVICFYYSKKSILQITKFKNTNKFNIFFSCTVLIICLLSNNIFKQFSITNLFIVISFIFICIISFLWIIKNSN